jgi:uncharacterized protein (DUF983 family)
VPPSLFYRSGRMSEIPPASPTTDRPPQPWLTGLLGRCPRCGRGPLFAGLLDLAPSCPSCGLDYAFADTGDGPSFFASFIGGFLVLLAGVYAQIVYEPGWWVYAILLIVGSAFCVVLIRPIKGILVALQYVTKAEQGRLET